MRITYFGHSAFQIKLDSGLFLLFDPYISKNPFTKVKVKDLNPDFIVLTHAHSDHIGDAIEIAHQSNAVIVAKTDLAKVLIESEGIKAIDYLNFGGIFYGDGFQLKLYPAWHTDAMSYHIPLPDHLRDGASPVYKMKMRDYDGIPLPMGVAAGFLLIAEDKLIYDAGDTGLFSDLKLVARKKPVDLAFLPIGGSFTMDADDAAAAAEFLQARKVIPIHYNTFDPIKADPVEFQKMLPKGVVEIPEIDEEFEF